jgi:hypothetical protein
MQIVNIYCSLLLSSQKKNKIIAKHSKLNIKKLRGLVRQRTIPTERPPFVGEVSANFSG